MNKASEDCPIRTSLSNAIAPLQGVSVPLSILTSTTAQSWRKLRTGAFVLMQHLNSVHGSGGGKRHINVQEHVRFFLCLASCLLEHWRINTECFHRAMCICSAEFKVNEKRIRASMPRCSISSSKLKLLARVCPSSTQHTWVYNTCYRSTAQNHSSRSSFSY